MSASRQCVIIVSGKGARLCALTKETPRPLLTVGGRPFLSYLIQEAARHNFRRILLLADFKAEAFSHEIAALRAATADDVGITVLVEAEPLGTGGALRLAADHLDEHFLLLKGDSLFDINLLDLTAPLSAAGIGRVALKCHTDVSQYGAVEWDGTHVRKLFEKNATGGVGLINGSVYWLSKAILDYIGSGMVSLDSDVLPKLAAQGRLYGTPYDRFMLDIGLPDTLEEAHSTVPNQMRRPALFLDRDGVINQDVKYAHRPSQIVWVDGAIQTIKDFNDAGYYVFVVTNQAGVARGYYDESDVQALHGWMAEEFAQKGAHVDEFTYCPYHPEGGVAKYAQASLFRKPAPGMILDLLQRWPVKRGGSFLIGDNATDLEAARAAGLPGYLFKGGNLADFAKNCLNSVFKK